MKPKPLNLNSLKDYLQSKFKTANIEYCKGIDCLIIKGNNLIFWIDKEGKFLFHQPDLNDWIKFKNLELINPYFKEVDNFKNL